MLRATHPKGLEQFSKARLVYFQHRGLRRPRDKETRTRGSSREGLPFKVLDTLNTVSALSMKPIRHSECYIILTLFSVPYWFSLEKVERVKGFGGGAVPLFLTCTLGIEGRTVHVNFRNIYSRKCLPTGSLI